MASPSSAIGGTEKPAWFSQEIVDIPHDARELLQSYSGIPKEQVIQHVIAQRKKAFEIFQYPCIGQLRFLSLNLSVHPSYAEVLQRIRSGETFLDAGCCFGQDIRKLVADGASATQLYGLDLEQDFLDLGYDLFRDRDTLQAHFFVGDVLDPTSNLDAVEGKMDMVFLSSFLHLWDWEHQIKAARRIVSLTAPRKGSLIIGRQLGSLVSGEFPTLGGKITNFRHDVQSLEKFWE